MKSMKIISIIKGKASEKCLRGTEAQKLWELFDTVIFFSVYLFLTLMQRHYPETIFLVIYKENLKPLEITKAKSICNHHIHVGICLSELKCSHLTFSST